MPLNITKLFVSREKNPLLSFHCRLDCLLRGWQQLYVNTMHHLGKTRVITFFFLSVICYQRCYWSEIDKFLYRVFHTVTSFTSFLKYLLSIDKVIFQGMVKLWNGKYILWHTVKSLGNLNLILKELHMEECCAKNATFHCG